MLLPLPPVLVTSCRRPEGGSLHCMTTTPLHAWLHSLCTILSSSLPPVAGKGFILYKRAAHRVILTQTQDIIVRPSHIEASMQARAWLSSVLPFFVLPPHVQRGGSVISCAP